MKYSKTTGGFYLEAIHGDNIPDDARPVTIERHAELMAAQSAGLSILADENGDPVAVASAETLLNSVNFERSRRWRGGFPLLISGVEKWFHSDEFSLTQHLGLKDRARDLLAAGGVMSDSILIGGQPVVWSTMDGSTVTITAQIAVDLVHAAGVQQAAIFAASQAHIAAINASMDLTGYDPTAGWPAVFEYSLFAG